MSQGHDTFQKPPTVTFRFIQRKNKFTTSGEVQDQNGQTVYRLVDRGEEHSMSFIKDYPLDIFRAHDNSIAASIEWGYKAKNTIICGLSGLGPGKVNMKEIVNEDFAFRMPDGSKFEWDGIYGYPWKLFDYRIAQPYSITPATSAIYKPRNYDGEKHMLLEVHRGALAMPGFLDWLVVTSLWLEYTVWEKQKLGELGNAASAFKESAISGGG